MASVIWIPKTRKEMQVVDEVLHRKSKVAVPIYRQHPLYIAKKYPPAGPDSREANRRRRHAQHTR